MIKLITVDLVILACLNFREFLILELTIFYFSSLALLSDYNLKNRDIREIDHLAKINTLQI